MFRATRGGRSAYARVALKAMFGNNLSSLTRLKRTVRLGSELCCIACALYDGAGIVFWSLFGDRDAGHFGEGASFEAQEQIKNLGSQTSSYGASNRRGTKGFGQRESELCAAYGITYADVKRIRARPRCHCYFAGAQYTGLCMEH